MVEKYFFNRKGKIIHGKYSGWYVTMVDDSEGETGGCYVIVNNPDLNSREAYDIWLEHKDEISEYMDELNWEIDWDI